MQDAFKATIGRALYDACQAGDLAAVKSLAAESGALHDPDWKTVLLTVAAGCNKPDIVSYCLSEGAKVKNETMMSVTGGLAFEAHKVMVSANAVDINFADPWQGDMLSLAVISSRPEWVRYYLTNGANPRLHKVRKYRSVIAAAAEWASTDIVDMLLEHGAVLEGTGALVLAAGKGRTDMVQHLIEKGADVDEKPVVKEDRRVADEMGTALHKAVLGVHLDTVRLLLDNGANPSVEDFKGREPMELASDQDSALIAMLKEAKKDQRI